MIISSSTKINFSPINKRKEIYNKRDKSWMENIERGRAIISSASKMGYSEFSERFATHDRKIRPIIAGWKSGGAIITRNTGTPSIRQV